MHLGQQRHITFIVCGFWVDASALFLGAFAASGLDSSLNG
jgi:hypothetical protein